MKARALSVKEWVIGVEGETIGTNFSSLQFGCEQESEPRLELVRTWHHGRVLDERNLCVSKY